VIGLGEALIAALVVAAILRTRPELLTGRKAAGEPQARAAARVRVPVAFALLAILALVLFGVPLASTRPDGLERVAAALGFASRAGGPSAAAPMPEYRAAFLGSGTTATWAAAFVGVLVVFLLSYALAAALARKPGACPPAATNG
jgi:hypothetical protein